jgi:hypothetical protein
MVTRADAAFDAGRLVCASLDDTMTRFGFAPGQIGTHPGGAGVVFCSGHREFRDRFPALAPQIDYTEPGACTDLNVGVTLDDRARVSEVHLDGWGLEELLHDVGSEDRWPRPTSAADSTLQDDLQHLDRLLREVFGRAEADQAGPR